MCIPNREFTGITAVNLLTEFSVFINVVNKWRPSYDGSAFNFRKRAFQVGPLALTACFRRQGLFYFHGQARLQAATSLTAVQKTPTFLNASVNSVKPCYE